MDRNDRMLTYLHSSNSDTNNAVCQAACEAAGFSVAGVEGSQTCRCGSTEDLLRGNGDPKQSRRKERFDLVDSYTSLLASNCNLECLGQDQYKEPCGGTGGGGINDYEYYWFSVRTQPFRATQWVACGDLAILQTPFYRRWKVHFPICLPKAPVSIVEEGVRSKLRDSLRQNQRRQPRRRRWSAC